MSRIQALHAGIPAALMPDTEWSALRSQARALQCAEPVLAEYLDRVVLSAGDFAQALRHLLAHKLQGPGLPANELAASLGTPRATAANVTAAARRDLTAIVDRDPSTDELLSAFLYHKGFHALQAHRVAHAHWHAGRRGLASFLQNRASEVFAVDIHPAARIGTGVFIDHATGVVIGETAVVGDDVSMLQGVTLGGTGKDRGDRHPKIGNNVLLCAGAKVLGNLRIGDGARVGAGSVVLDHVRPYTTVVGVPARAVREHLPAALRPNAIDFVAGLAVDAAAGIS